MKQAHDKQVAQLELYPGLVILNHTISLLSYFSGEKTRAGSRAKANVVDDQVRVELEEVAGS